MTFSCISVYFNFVLTALFYQLKDDRGNLMGVDTSNLLIANSGNDLPVRTEGSAVHVNFATAWWPLIKSLIVPKKKEKERKELKALPGLQFFYVFDCLARKQFSVILWYILKIFARITVSGYRSDKHFSRAGISRKWCRSCCHGGNGEFSF